MEKKFFLFDSSVVDCSQTTAIKQLNHPTKKEVAFTFDKPWEGDCGGFYTIVHHGGIYRMYFSAWAVFEGKEKAKDNQIRICVIESKDGQNWYRPIVGSFDYNGSKENNIVIDNTVIKNLDNFFVFYDDNPNCKDTERFKAIARMEMTDYLTLGCFVSSDGLHFKFSHNFFNQCFGKEINGKIDEVTYDTLSTVMWDKENNVYRLYSRGFHDKPLKADPSLPPEDQRNLGYRDIRYSESTDFINWIDPIRVNFSNKVDYPLYTNLVSKYCSNPDIYIGFPTRYTEYFDWNDSFEELCGKELRKNRMEKIQPRLGLAITDCLFMYSKDGKTFERFDDAFMTSGPEDEFGWVYGSCYPSFGFIKTLEDKCDSDKVLSFYCAKSHFSGVPVEIVRYTIRQDGFVSYYGNFEGKTLITNEFDLEDYNALQVNFASSSAGYLIAELLVDGEVVATSQKHFGDKIDRKVKFDKDLSNFANKKVSVKFYLKDCSLYSFTLVK